MVRISISDHDHEKQILSQCALTVRSALSRSSIVPATPRGFDGYVGLKLMKTLASSYRPFGRHADQVR